MSRLTATKPQTHTSLTQKREFIHRSQVCRRRRTVGLVAEDAPWASSQKTHTPRKARTRVAKDATRICAVAEDCLFTPH